MAGLRTSRRLSVPRLPRPDTLLQRQRRTPARLDPAVPPAAPAPTPALPAQTGPTIDYVVAGGDTLAQIATARIRTRWVAALYDANRDTIGDPNVIIGSAST